MGRKWLYPLYRSQCKLFDSRLLPVLRCFQKMDLNANPEANGNCSMEFLQKSQRQWSPTTFYVLRFTFYVLCCPMHSIFDEGSSCMFIQHKWPTSLEFHIAFLMLPRHYYSGYDDSPCWWRRFIVNHCHGCRRGCCLPKTVVCKPMVKVLLQVVLFHYV